LRQLATIADKVNSRNGEQHEHANREHVDDYAEANALRYLWEIPLIFGNSAAASY